MFGRAGGSTRLVLCNPLDLSRSHARAQKKQKIVLIRQQRQRHAGPARGAHADHGPAHGRRHLLHELQHQPGLEIREWSSFCVLLSFLSRALFRSLVFRARFSTPLSLNGKSLPRPPSQQQKTNPQEHAFEETQKYKEGKFIVETARVLKQGW